MKRNSVLPIDFPRSRSFSCVYFQIGRCQYFVNTQSKSGLSEIVRFEAIFLFFSPKVEPMLVL